MADPQRVTEGFWGLSRIWDIVKHGPWIILAVIFVAGAVAALLWRDHPVEVRSATVRKGDAVKLRGYKRRTEARGLRGWQTILRAVLGRGAQPCAS